MSITEEKPALNNAIRAVRDAGLDTMFHGFADVARREDVGNDTMVAAVRLLCGDDIADMFELWLDEDQG